MLFDVKPSHSGHLADETPVCSCPSKLHLFLTQVPSSGSLSLEESFQGHKKSVRAKHDRSQHWTLLVLHMDLNHVSGPSLLNSEVERRSTYKNGKNNQKQHPKMEPSTECHGTQKSMNKCYPESQVKDNRCCISLSQTSSCPWPTTERAWAEVWVLHSG